MQTAMVGTIGKLPHTGHSSGVVVAISLVSFWVGECRAASLENDI